MNCFTVTGASSERPFPCQERQHSVWLRDPTTSGEKIERQANQRCESRCPSMLFKESFLTLASKQAIFQGPGTCNLFLHADNVMDVVKVPRLIQRATFQTKKKLINFTQVSKSRMKLHKQKTTEMNLKRCSLISNEYFIRPILMKVVCSFSFNSLALFTGQEICQSFHKTKQNFL